MIGQGPSWAELLAEAKTPEQKISLQLAVLRHQADPYAEFIRLINRAIDCGLSELSRQKNLVHELSEDQLSVMLVGHLKGMSFLARHGENNGGHTDITIDGPDQMRWIGEAKKYTSYSKLFGGARQLVNRYSAGTKHQDHGAIIVYISKPNALGIMNRWRDYLRRFVPEMIIDDQEAEQIDFLCHLKHMGSGRTIHARNVAAVLYHKPTDTMGSPKKGRIVGLGVS